MALGQSVFLGKFSMGALLKQFKRAIRISMGYGRGIFYESEYHHSFTLLYYRNKRLSGLEMLYNLSISQFPQ